MKRVSNAIQCFLYPPYCIHCNSYIEKGGALFCFACAHFFDFFEMEEGSSSASCFEYYGAVATFIKTLKSNKMPYLAKSAASLLFLQFIHLEWPQPDLVIPVPSRALFAFNDHLHLIAKYLASLLKSKSRQPLKRRPGRPRQTELSREERMTLSPADFLIKDLKRVRGKNILLIDDVMTTGSTLRSIKTLLKAGGAEDVYALVLAESVVY